MNASRNSEPLAPTTNHHYMSPRHSVIQLLRVGTGVIGYRGWFTVVGAAARRGKQQQLVITHAGIPSAPTIDRRVPTSQFKVQCVLMKPLLILFHLYPSCLRWFRADNQIDMTSFVWPSFIAVALSPVGPYRTRDKIMMYIECAQQPIEDEYLDLSQARQFGDILIK